jgi:hypothetical protein
MKRRDLIAAGALLAACPAWAQPSPPRGIRPGSGSPEREALLIEGKRTLRQRVLSRPQAAPRPRPGAPAAGQPLTPLTPLFVFARSTGPDGQPWIEVGRASRGETLGWLPAREAIDWPHTMTAAFTSPAGRERTLFFRARDPLVATLGGRDPQAEARSLGAVAARPPVPADFPVLAAEPATHVDIRSQFYLLPILAAEELSYQDGRRFRIVEVASVPVSATPPAPREPFSLGIAFVVDTTLSMEPYIERVRTALNEIVRQSAAARDRSTRYALVGFRNSLEVQPRLDYLTRIFGRFADNADPAAFARWTAQMSATDVDSLSYNEDPLAGIRAAMDELDWQGIGGKMIVLVTDAGARDGRDPASATRLSPAALARIAQERGFAIATFHLKTPQGARMGNHQQAERQYISLSNLPNVGPQYFPVENGDEAAFAQQIGRFLEGVRRYVAQAQGQQGPGAAPSGDDAADRAAMIGHALRLAWLGRQDQSAAPDLIRAWAPTAWQPDPARAENLEVRVLLTRNQLNDMAQAVSAIVEAGRSRMLDSNAVFERLQSVAAHLARDPSRLRERGMETLGDILGEYLDGLPYVSEIAEYDRASWQALGPGRQIQILDSLEGRVRAYEEINRTRDLWVSFDGGRDRGEEVFPVPLSLLP